MTTTLDPRLYELLGLLKKWVDEERTASRKLSTEAAVEANQGAFSRAAVLATKAAISDAQAGGLSLACIELRDTLKAMVDSPRFPVLPSQTLTEAIAES